MKSKKQIRRLRNKSKKFRKMKGGMDGRIEESLEDRRKRSMPEAALRRAIRQSNESAALHYLSKVSNVNFVYNDTGETALHKSCMNGLVKVVIALIDKGATVDAKDINGMTPLHWTCQVDNAEMVEFLISMGADVNACNNYGRTPLHFACQYRRMNVAVSLVDRGADINAMDIHQKTPLDYIKSDRDREYLELFTEIKVEDAMASLLDKSEARHTLNELADTPNLTISGFPEVMVDKTVSFIGRGGGKRKTKKLKTLRRKTRKCRAKGGTSEYDKIFNEIFYGPTDKAIEIIKNGKLNNDFLDKDNNNPLHYACTHLDDNNFELFQELINIGYDINAVERSRGDTPLHLAIKRDKPNIITVLLNNNVDINIKNEEGKSPLHIAVEKNNIEIFKKLLNKGSNVNDDNYLNIAVGRDNIEITKILLSEGADINYVDPDDFLKETVLYTACTSLKDNSILVEFLLQNGAIRVINERNSLQITPLHAACNAMNIENIKLLLFYGADLYAKNAEGKMPLELLSKIEKYSDKKNEILKFVSKFINFKYNIPSLKYKSYIEFLQNNNIIDDEDKDFFENIKKEIMQEIENVEVEDLIFTFINQ